MFWKKLTLLRKEKGLSQEELGDKIGVSRQTIYKWEQGLSIPDANNLLALADFFGCSVDELLRETSPREEPQNSVPPADRAEDGAEEEKTQPMPEATRKFEYEYKSRTTVGGVPLVHIHVGFGLCRAKGIIAVGNVATGLISIGGVAVGLLSLGGLALGVLSLGGLAFALLAALGGVAVALLCAIGGVAVGILAIGGFAVGTYAVGGLAFGESLAMGGYAEGKIALGEYARGETVFLKGDLPAASEIRAAIEATFPGLWTPLVDLFSFFGK